MRLPVRIDHLQSAGAHERLQHVRQWEHAHLCTFAASGRFCANPARH
jgi:hypothetical protein